MRVDGALVGGEGFEVGGGGVGWERVVLFWNFGGGGDCHRSGVRFGGGFCDFV